MTRRSKLQPGQRVSVDRPMWGLEAGIIGTLTQVAPDRVTGTFVPDQSTYSYTLPLSYLSPSGE